MVAGVAISACGEAGLSGSSGAKANKYVVAVDPTLMPMAYVNDQNVLDGFEIDLIRAVARTAGFDVEFTPVEFAGLFGGLVTRKFDLVISSITILEERKKRMAFSRPYLRSGLALLVRREDDSIRSVEDLRQRGLLVGAQTGTTSHFFLQQQPGVKIQGYQLFGHAVTDLINGRIDAVIGESTGALYYRNREKENFAKIKMTGEILTREYYGIVLRKEDAALLAKVNAALEKLLSDGTIRQLHDKWDLGRAAEPPPLETRS